MKRRIRLYAFAALALLPSIAHAASPPACATPPVLGDGWPVSSPEAQRLDPVPVCAIDAQLKTLAGADPHGVVIVRNGTLVYETYFTGLDQRWPQQHWDEPATDTPHDATTKHDIQSITKSVVALLVGAAIDRGLIKGVDAPLLAFFPEYADLNTPERQRITLQDLLTMRAGLDWPLKPYLSMARRVAAARDPYRLILQQPMVAPAGEKWFYNNGVADLVGGLVQKATHQRLDQFAKEVLFDPLGITDWEWGHMDNGDAAGSWGLLLRPRDLAKIGQLILNDGAWGGRQIISAGWIKEMTATRVQASNGGYDYAYLWWRDRSSQDGRNLEWIIGSGWGGQCLDIIPELALVVVVTAGVYDRDGGGSQNLACDLVMDKAVMPAARGR